VKDHLRADDTGQGAELRGESNGVGLVRDALLLDGTLDGGRTSTGERERQKCR
jgi:hypothetical protein